MAKPGQPARGTRTGRPVMVLLDLLGRRWAMRVLWELRNGPMSFRQLRECCDEVSPSVLNARLHELREARLVERSEGGYILAPTAWELVEAFKPLNRIATRWAEETAKHAGN